MFAKVFRSLWDGTLGPDWIAWSVFVFLLAHADREGFVDMSQEAISARSGIPLDEVRKALERLEAPDQRSRSQELDGRRLERIDAHRDWGWRIVRYEHYRGMRDAEERARQNREAQRRHRKPVSARVSHGQPASAYADVEVEAEESPTPLHRPPAAAKAGGMALRNGGRYYPPEALRQEIASAYPDADVDLEFQRAALWLETNRGKRKTMRGMPAFLRSWVARSDGKASENGHAPDDPYAKLPVLTGRLPDA